MFNPLDTVWLVDENDPVNTHDEPEHTARVIMELRHLAQIPTGVDGKVAPSPTPSDRATASKRGRMAEGTMELADDVVQAAGHLQVAVDDGDIDGAKEQIKKVRSRLDELEKAIEELPASGDVGDED